MFIIDQPADPPRAGQSSVVSLALGRGRRAAVQPEGAVGVLPSRQAVSPLMDELALVDVQSVGRAGVAFRNRWSAARVCSGGWKSLGWNHAQKVRP